MMQITTANASAFLLLMMLKLHMKKQSKKSYLLDVKILSAMIHLTMFQCFFDTLVFWIDGREFPMARELNYLGNVMYYILNMAIAYCWPLFTEYKLNSSTEKVKRLAIIQGIPQVILTLLIATSPFTGFIFTISEDNVYARTSWHFFVPTVLIIFYVLFGTIRIYSNRKGRGKYMIFPAIYFVTPITLAMIVQTMNYGISLIFIGIAIGLAGIYLSTQSESAYLDPLCGVYNRRYYNDYIRAFCNSKNRNTTMGVLVDLDDFKQINDCFGHDVGDEALIQFSEVLRKYVHGIGFVFRYGGDEFILIIHQPEGVVQATIDSIEKEIKRMNASGENPFRLAFSYGITEITTDSEEFLRTSDQRMYEMKKARKS